MVTLQLSARAPASGDKISVGAIAARSDHKEKSCPVAFRFSKLPLRGDSFAHGTHLLHRC